MWINEFKNCKLCYWECGVNRVNGEIGICRIGLPEIATIDISIATNSITVTFLGCCFRCIYCNAYRISQYPSVGWFYRGYIEPEKLADELINFMKLKNINAISFTGGEPTINMPYIEEVVNIVREKIGNVKVGFATNGFSSINTMKRMIDLSSFISFEVKAFDDEIHRAITGAPIKPVLRNIEYLIRNGRDKIRVIRTVVIPGINDNEIEKIAEFIASIDESIPYRIIGYRPNFILYYHPGPSRKLMEELTEKAKKKGLKNVDWSAYYPIEIHEKILEISRKIDWCEKEEAKIAYAYLSLAGCIKKIRDCGSCELKNSCPAMLWRPWALQEYLK
jgi:pyruvate formate lyase activating enzyme